MTIIQEPLPIRTYGKGNLPLENPPGSGQHNYGANLCTSLLLSSVFYVKYTMLHCVMLIM